MPDASALSKLHEGILSTAVPVIGSFTAPKRVPMGPGRSDVHSRVLAAAAQGTIGHSASRVLEATA